MVAELIEGVVYDVPVYKTELLEFVVYHLTSPALAVAEIVAVPVVQMFAPEDDVMVGIAVTVPVTAVLAEEQPPLTASA